MRVYYHEFAGATPKNLRFISTAEELLGLRWEENKDEPPDVRARTWEHSLVYSYYQSRQRDK